MKNECVYVIQIVPDGPVKIGWTKNLQKRVRGIEGGLPGKIRVLAVFPGGMDLERRLHAQFAHLRLRGEWFRNDKEIIDMADRRQERKTGAEICSSCGRHRSQHRIEKLPALKALFLEQLHRFDPPSEPISRDGK